MEVTYRKNLHRSYMCVKAQEEIAEGYELCMLEGRKIPHLLVMQTIQADGEREYLYDISGKQQLEDYLSGKKMDYRLLWEVLCSIRELCFVLQEYLLREGGICLEAEYIYVNLADGKLYFAYLPFWDKCLPETFGRYMEQMLRKIDHQDRMAAELGYHVYQKCMMENAAMQEIFDSILIKEGNAMPDSELGIKTEIKEQGYEGPCVEHVEEPVPKKKLFGNLSGANAILAGKAAWLGRFIDSFKEGAERKGCPEPAAVEQASPKSRLWKKIFPHSFQKEARSKTGFEKTGGEKQKEALCYPKSGRKGFNKGSAKKTLCQNVAAKEYGEGCRKETCQKEPDVTENLLKNNNVYGMRLAGRMEPAHPTEVLGARMQEPAGKLIYQGIHGCADILVSGDAFLLGKNAQQAAGIIEAEGISRLHAKISKQEGDYYLEDLNSTNGTYLNGNPVEYHQKKKLHKGDKIRLGAEEFLFS